LRGGISHGRNYQAPAAFQSTRDRHTDERVEEKPGGDGRAGGKRGSPCASRRNLPGANTQDPVRKRIKARTSRPRLTGRETELNSPSTEP